jgi:hypothetical protein
MSPRRISSLIMLQVKDDFVLFEPSRYWDRGNITSCCTSLYTCLFSILLLIESDYFSFPISLITTVITVTLTLRKATQM